MRHLPLMNNRPYLLPATFLDRLSYYVLTKILKNTTLFFEIQIRVNSSWEYVFCISWNVFFLKKSSLQTNPVLWSKTLSSKILFFSSKILYKNIASLPPASATQTQITPRANMFPYSTQNNTYIAKQTHK